MTRRWFEPLVIDASSKRPLLPIPGAGLALVAAIVGATGATAVREFSRMPPWERDAFVATALAMIVLTFAWTSRRRAAVAGYWLVQTLAATALTLASRGHGALIVLPVLAQSVFILPRRALVPFAGYFAALTVFATRARATSWPSAVNIASGHLAGIVFVVVFTELLLRERQTRARNEALAAALATTRERARIARDVHDILGHSLTAVHAQLTGALAVRERDPARAAELLQRARALTETGLNDVRRSVSALREEKRASFADELRSLLATAEATGITARLVVHGPASEEPTSTSSLELFRVVQESVTNAIRHGRAAHVTVTLTYGENDLELQFDDDGVGAESVVPRGGLRSVRERVELLGGEVAIETSPGNGFHLRARVPRREHADVTASDARPPIG